MNYNFRHLIEKLTDTKLTDTKLTATKAIWIENEAVLISIKITLAEIFSNYDEYYKQHNI